MSQYSVLHVYFLCIYVTGSAKRALNTFYYILQCTAKSVIMACVSDFSFFFTPLDSYVILMPCPH